MKKKHVLKYSLILNFILFIFLTFTFIYLGGISKVSSAIQNRNSELIERTEEPIYLNRESVFESLKTDNDDIILIGDSITQRNEWAEAMNNPHIINRGIDSDTVYGVAKRIHLETQDQPKQIFIEIGINDIYHENDLSLVFEYYQEIAETIKNESPNTEVFIISAMPVNNTKYSHPINNQDVQNYNVKLKELAEKNEFTFIDIYSAFIKSGTNEMDEKYTYDGVHPNSLGYEVMQNNLKPYIK